MYSGKIPPHTSAGQPSVAKQDTNPVPPGEHVCSHHVVQFYEQDEALIKSLAKFVGEGFRKGETAVVIATPEHRRALEDRLCDNGTDIELLESTGAHLALDAEETLSRFMLDGIPDDGLFVSVMEPVMMQARARGQPVRAFGEMVALLCAEGNPDAAIRLENLWNRLSSRYTFSLLCAYPVRCFSGLDDENALRRICASHAHVIPAENFPDHGSEQEQATAVTLLQCQAASLEAEAGVRRSTEESLHHKEAAMAEFETFAHSISHDLKGPLRTMRGHVEILLKDFGRDIPSAANEHLQRIAAASEMMNDLVQGVLNSNRNGTSGLDLARLDLNELIAELLATRPEFRPPLAEITIEGPLPSVLGDRSATLQSLSNLLENAVKFTAPQTTPVVRISTKAPEQREADKNPQRRVRLCIEDNGIGLPPEAQANIFDLFHRAHVGYEGTGVGLASVKKAVERMGGRAGHKPNPAGGSIFWIDLQAAGD